MNDRGDLWGRGDRTPPVYCRFRKKANQRKFGLFKAIGWSLGVLNRMECAEELRYIIIYA